MAGAPIAIILLIGTPVKSTSDDVVAAGRICVVIASRLGNINFARCGPRSKGIVDWQHPDCGPKPITHGHCSYNFNTTVFNGCAFEGIDAA